MNSSMAATIGDADSASGAINRSSPPFPCEADEACPKCLYRKYEPDPEQEFRKKLSRSDLQLKGSYRLYLSKLRAVRFCPPTDVSEVSFYDVQMKRWPMYFRRSGGKAYLTRGWSCFAQAKQLSKGDTITFYELNCKRGTGKRVFMIGISHKQCIQILGAPIRN